MAGLATFVTLYVSVAFTLFLLAATWVLFEKAHEPGWLGLIPIVNLFVLLKIVKKPWWWFILLLIPIVQVVPALFLMMALAEQFGRSNLFGVGLFLLGFVFVPLLAFGDAEYRGDAV